MILVCVIYIYITHLINIMSNKEHFINIKLQQITAKNNIHSNFDYETSEDFYEKTDENGIPIIYNFLYKYILKLPKDKKIITMSPDPVISASTIVGLAEKYMYTDVQNNNNEQRVVYKSNLKIIYFTAKSHLSNEFLDPTIKNLSSQIISNAMCTVENTFTRHNLAVSPTQFILVGINTDIVENTEIDDLNKQNITFFSINQIRKKKINKIIDTINDMIGDDPVHIIFDMSCMSIDIAPCVTRFVDLAQHEKIDGFGMNEIEHFFNEINKKSLVGLDITGYDLRINNSEQAFRVMCEIPQRVLQIALEIKEKKLNIFNEHSKFLIWRPIDQDSDNDTGWFILKNIALDIREKLISHIGDDKIITIQTEDDDGEQIESYVTVTSFHEQQNRTFYAENTIFDCVLFPAQKMYSMFELLNTNENSIVKDC